MDRGVMPGTYSRRTYRSAAGVDVARSPVAATLPGSGGTSGSRADTEIQSDEHAFGVREIADDLLDRFGQPAHERGNGENLIALRELWILHEIDHLDLVSAVQMRLADVPQVREGENRFRRLSGDVQPQLVGLLGRCRHRGRAVKHRHVDPPSPVDSRRATVRTARRS